MYRLLLSCAWIGIAGTLSACGGGVDLAPPPPPSKTPTVPITTETPPTDTPPVTTPPPATGPIDIELADSKSASLSGAPAAWQQGATGQGVKIGFLDTGVNAALPDIAANLDSGSKNIGGSAGMFDTSGHGTATASIAAGVRNGSGVVGVAPDARIVMIKVDKPNSCPENCDFADLADGVNAAVAGGAQVVNVSLKSGPTSDLVDAVKAGASRGVIFVVAAANDGEAEASELARAIASAAAGKGIIVGGLGVGELGSVDYSQLSAKSNAAGSFRDWYIAAPGRLVTAAYNLGGINTISGTSFAAPAVSGAIALLLQAFPNLSATDVVQILLSSADDLGARGTDSIYGRGGLNIARAFQPIGATTLAGSSLPVAPINGTAPAAAGDALSSGTLNAVMLDGYSRAFTVNLASTIRDAADATPMSWALGLDTDSAAIETGRVAIGLSATRVDGALRLGFANPDVGLQKQSKLAGVTITSDRSKRSTFALSLEGRSTALERALSGDSASQFFVNANVLDNAGFVTGSTKAAAARRSLGALAVGASYETGKVTNITPDLDKASYRLIGASLDRQVGALSVLLAAKTLRESRSVLGGSLSPLFGKPGASTLFVDAQASHRLAKGLSLQAVVRHGWTNFEAGRFASNAFSVGLTKNRVIDNEDTVTFRFSQPLRVRAGGLLLQLPTTYDYASGATSLAGSSLGLVPTGRELVAEVGYARALSRGGALTLNGYARHEPGHRASAKPDLGALIKVKVKF